MCVHETAEPLDGMHELPDTQTAQQTDVNETYSPLLLRLVRPAMPPPPPRRLFVRPRSENVKRGSERGLPSPAFPCRGGASEAPSFALKFAQSSHCISDFSLLDRPSSYVCLIHMGSELERTQKEGAHDQHISDMIKNAVQCGLRYR